MKEKSTDRWIKLTLKNTDNSYKITVVNRQTIDGKTDTIEETACGSYYEKNGKQYIIYKAVNEGGTISSMIKIDGEEMVIKRSGEVSSSMTYRADRKSRFMYNLPYGSLEMEIDTQRLVTRLGERGGTVELMYTLTVQGEKYFNDMKITVVKR